MIQARGLPDWQAAVETEDFTFLPLFADAQRHVAVPKGLRLVDRPDGKPDFGLEFVSNENLTDPAQSLFAMLRMGVVRTGDTLAAYDALVASKPTATVLPATFTTEAYWYIEAVGAQQAVQPFAWEDIDQAHIWQRVDKTVGQLVYSALGGTQRLAASAAIECGIAAMLPRVGATVTASPSALIASLAALAVTRGAASVPFERIVAYFRDDVRQAPLTFDTASDRVPRGDLALALAGRVVHHLATVVRTPRIADGSHVALRASNDPSLSDQLVWDLNAPRLVNLPRLLRFDPFTRVLRGGGREAVTTFVRVPPLPNDRLTQRVTVSPHLPPNIRDVDGIDVTLRVGADLSRSGRREVQTLNLLDDQTSKVPVELKYRKAQPKRYSAQIRVAWESGMRESGWVECTDDFLFIGTERLPGHYLSIRAAADLLRQACLDVTLTGARAAGSPSVTLDAATPAATFLVESVPDTAGMRIVAHDISDPRRSLTLGDLPCRSLGVELLSFPDYGTHLVDICVNFHSGVQTATFDFLSESGMEEPIRLQFTPIATRTTLTYVATNMFRSRFRYRAVHADSEEADWSAYLSPYQPLTLSG